MSLSSGTTGHHDTTTLTLLGRAILASRYILMVFFFGLAFGLALFAARFVVKLWGLATTVLDSAEEDFLISVLHLVDSALIASLVMIVVLASYDSLVDRLSHEAEREDLRWVARTNYGNLKLKVATAMVAISSIHLLQVFLKLENYSTEGIMWRTIIHTVFVMAALLLGLLDKITHHGKSEDNESV